MTGKRVLVVESRDCADRRICEIIREHCSGVEAVHQAYSEGEALGVYESFRPSVVVLDLVGRKRWALLDTLRAREDRPYIVAFGIFSRSECRRLDEYEIDYLWLPCRIVRLAESVQRGLDR